MRKRTFGLLGSLAVAASLALTPTAHAGASPASATTNTPQLVILQGLDFFPPNRPAQVVDIYLAQDGAVVKEISHVYLGAALYVNQLFPGFVKPGFFVVDVVKQGQSSSHPLLITAFPLRPGQSKTVATYFAAGPKGKQGAPTISVFNNDIAPTNGQARLTVYHLAVAPTVGVYADGTTAITPSFSNGQSATAQVPAGAYKVTVTAPNTPSDVLYKAGRVPLAPNTLTEAFANGFYPSLFGVDTITIPLGA